MEFWLAFPQLLRGRVNGKNEARREEAQGVLDVYESLGDPERKAEFLRDFETNGGGKGKDALKFAATFKKTAESDKTVDVSVVDNYCTGPLRLPFCFLLLLWCADAQTLVKNTCVVVLSFLL